MSIKPKQIVPLFEALLSVRKENNEVWDTFKAHYIAQYEKTHGKKPVHHTDEQILEAFVYDIEQPIVEYAHSYKCGKCDNIHLTTMAAFLLNMDNVDETSPSFLSQHKDSEHSLTTGLPPGSVLRNVTLLLPFGKFNHDDEGMCAVLEPIPELVYARRGTESVVTLPETFASGITNMVLPKNALH